jgi:Domain of unknown function (DUF222)/HNH endonuclease
MPHDPSMAGSAARLESARERAVAAIDDYAVVLGETEGSSLGDGLIHTLAMKDRLEAVFAEGLRRFDRSNEYKADGALDLVGWLRMKCRLPGGNAAERVGIARQLEHLPQTQQAFANGELGYHSVAVMAHTAEHVGAAVVRKAETELLEQAKALDAGQFTNVARNFEHRVDAAAALSEANRAYQRRYLNIGEPRDGVVRFDGQVDAEGGAALVSAIKAHVLPAKDDDRTPGQRRIDALIQICRGKRGGSADGSGPRPHVIVRATVETLVGAPNAPAGEIDGVGTVPAETVQRLACDAALTRMTGKGELDAEITRATRTIQPATRRALAERDRGCVAESCNRPPEWTDAHHVQHWAHGGPTTLPNLILLCRPHHRMVHEEGWGLRRLANGRWALLRPMPRSRSA